MLKTIDLLIWYSPFKPFNVFLNAASVASMVLTTESLVSDIKEPATAPQMPVDPSMGGMY